MTDTRVNRGQFKPGHKPVAKGQTHSGQSGPNGQPRTTTPTKPKLATKVPESLHRLPSRGTVLYKAGAAHEQKALVILVAAPMDDVIAHVDQVMVLANKGSELGADKAEFWLGVLDAAYAFYQIRRKRSPRPPLAD